MNIEDVIARRKRLKVTQTELADAAGVSRQDINTIERLRLNDAPTIERLNAAIDRVARNKFAEEGVAP